MYQNQFDTVDGNAPFSFDQFGNAVGDAVTGVFQNISGTLDANALNSVAIANLNAAQADAVRSKAANQAAITKNIFTIVLVAILAVVVVAIISKFTK